MDIPAKAKKFTEHVARNIELLASGQFSDFILQCDDHQFHVHRIILLGHSKFFDALIKHAFQESAQGFVDLPEDDIETLAIVLWFMYTAEFAPKINANRILSNDQKCRFLKWAPYAEDLISTKYSGSVRIAQAADRYDMPELESFAFHALNRALEGASLTELNQDKDFEQAIQMAFDESNITSRAASLIAWNLASKLADPEQDIELLSSYIEAIPAFSWSVLSENARSLNPIGKTCKGCRNIVEHFDKRYVLVQIRDIETENAGIIWLGCVCLFRGFCSSSCRLYTADASSLTSYCSSCRSAEGQETRFCHLAEGSWGGLQVMEEGFDCKASLENDEEYIFRV